MEYVYSFGYPATGHGAVEGGWPSLDFISLNVGN